MSVGDAIRIGLGALVGALLTFAIFGTLNALLWLPAAEKHGRDLEAADLTAATNKAIGELSNAADQARVRRRLCSERGGLYHYDTGECVEAKPVGND
ncbi:hypothetical protein [Rhizobium leguminosarum]|uniref:hypothetical protein n=1 Tax=Rhizobium leguminosarum TaxID=384 RepID=UPI001031CAEF|nr:hypothetical protein [Rhizobium leguminosarum]TAV89331.1 hypothetical protein ELI22_08955 [Rhizobium leguminosarum]TAV93912.1 hypothetical protein ELI21_08945 [Rhizobium leguminosarum]TAW34989.1 hypothetical protein ELI23_08985 [Rhizobium leguminosarum]